MLRDVFYFGNKPNVHPREQYAENLIDARQKSTTRDFWIINEFSDYRNFDWDFDFEFLPDEDVWAEDHNNVWPSQHQKDGGTWLCSKEHSDIIIYRNDVDPVFRKNEKTDNWVELDLIDQSKFDFSWHPDPTDPPYIYKWGCKFFPAQIKHVLEYRVDGATQEKYMNTIAELVPQYDLWKEFQKVDTERFDLSWRPNPLDPPFIYVWGNKYVDGKLKPTLEYHAPGATNKKYMPEHVPVLPEWDRWRIVEDIITESFDFSWRPDPREPAFIYVFGNEQYDGTVMPTIEYHCPGATDIKYIHDIKAKLAPKKELFDHLENCDGIDYSWRPDPTSPPYIYAWGNQWNIPEDKISVQYVVEGATEYKYMTERATRKPCMDNWIIPNDVDVTGFDFSWEPSPAAPPCIYEFGTQWQKTGGPQYVVPGATEKQYVDLQKVTKLPSRKNWDIPLNVDVTDFDFSWHPDETEPAYIYQFGTQWSITGGPRYVVENASEIKYIDSITAKALPDKTNWVYDSTLVDVDSFDFSWHPYAEDDPFIYQFGTQWQKTGGPQYVVPGATQIKYIDTRILKATRLPSLDNWVIPDHVTTSNFDFSWHPDDTAEPYIYEFGTQWQKTGGPRYIADGATEVSYVEGMTAIIGPSTDNWDIPDGIIIDEFDFSWHPDPTDPPYIYEFGTQWQKTGGPRYVVDGAIETKYVETQKVTKISVDSNWEIPDYIDVDTFDFTWHPDSTNPLYDYVFPTQWAKSGGPVYRVRGSIGVKYIEDQTAKANPCMKNWVFDPKVIDVDTFDFSWHPHIEDGIYIYQFGTQWQKTGGPKYVTPGADNNSPVKYIDTDILRATRLPNRENTCWNILYSISEFDFSWHPDDTEDPYIYVFGNNLYPAEECYTIEYRVPGATDKKYVNSIIATLAPDLTNWDIPDNIDISEFDFSWVPNPTDGKYIYEFGTQWQKTGGPKYNVIGAKEIKYVDFQKAKALPNMANWEIPSHIDISEFDLSWHPDETEPAYIYQFGTQWSITGGPRYVVDGATEIKYADDITAKALPSMDNWLVPENIDIESFDFSWHPYLEDQPYIYEFGTQWQKTGGPRYMTPGADSSSPIKYIDTRIMKATRLPNAIDSNWNILYPISDFDFSWHPDNTEEPYIYVFGNQWHSAEIMPTIEYAMPGAKAVKYVSSTIATLAPDKTNWEIPTNIDVSEFDFSWVPEPEMPPYIHQFGTQWQKTSGPRYIVKDATETKYVDVQKAKMLATRERWEFPENIDVSDFDFSWHPDETEPAYIYQFGTQWSITGGPTYTVPGATETKYVDDIIAKALPDKTNWVYNENEIDVDSFDFSWHPYVEDQPYIYQFGTQWQKTGGPRYMTPGANSSSPIKYIDTRILKANRLPNRSNFRVLNNYKIKSFDYSWHPDDTSPEYVYVFGNNLYSAEECATIEYKVGNATEITFVTEIVAKLDKNMKNWEIPSNVDVSKFDFSWIPHPAATPYIYQFGTSQDPNDGPRYITPDTTGEVIYVPRLEISDDEIEVVDEIKKYYIETTIEDLIEQHPDEIFWALSKTVDYDDFNFDWEPSIEQIQYVNVFGSSESISSQTYFVNSAWWHKGLREFNFVDEQEKKTVEELDIFYVDRGNKEAESRFELLKNQFGAKIQKTRYLNSWVDTINRCTNRATSNLIWVLNSELDYTDFNFDYYPNPWQMKMVHVFGTQWSHWGTTFMVNRETFREDTKYIKIIEHLSNLNFVKNIRARATKCVHDIVVVDHGNKETQTVIDLLHSKAPDVTITSVKYDTSYLKTLKDLIRRQQEKKEHFIWVCSSVCDYTNFDFTYICDPFAKDNLHVFPSNKQKFGDTFFIDVNKAREVINDLDELENFTKVNYNSTVRAERLPEPVIVIADDTHTNAINAITDFPYATLITSDNIDVGVVDVEPMNLWSDKTKNIYVTSTGATRIVVPKEITEYVKKELYEYPYIKRASKLALSKPLDIVFLSNGEAIAEENYEHLLNITKSLSNRVVRVDGVNGRVAAYHAAAEASETPWFFTVFAKLKTSPKFDFNWQPDRMQVPKHYIFHAKNPVNGLVYGHQAMIAYNKKLTLANAGKGLDFTLDDEHEVVPLISGTAMYNTDEFSTWRTAFREVIKLKADPTDIAKERLDAWLNKAQGEFSQYSIKGAVDAEEYFDEVNGDFDMLKLSYEWEWLKKKFTDV